MIKFKRLKFYLIIIILLIYIKFKDTFNDEHCHEIPRIKEDEMSIIVSMKNMTKNKHILFLNVMRKLKTTRNYYFIKTFGNPLNDNLNKLVKDSPIKIVQSNFPDSMFLPLVVSLYGITIPELVLFIEGEELMDKSGKYLIKWVSESYKTIMVNNYDYIFGNSLIIEGKKIGCSLLLSKASIIEHLLYYTDSDTSHVNPFIQLSVATQTKFCFIQFNYIKFSSLEYNHKKMSLNMNCPSTKDKNMPSFCIILPNFKRNY